MYQLYTIIRSLRSSIKSQQTQGCNNRIDTRLLYTLKYMYVKETFTTQCSCHTTKSPLSLNQTLYLSDFDHTQAPYQNAYTFPCSHRQIFTAFISPILLCTFICLSHCHPCTRHRLPMSTTHIKNIKKVKSAAYVAIAAASRIPGQQIFADYIGREMCSTSVRCWLCSRGVAALEQVAE